MLKLRRGRVLSVESADSRTARLTVELDGGEARPAVAYPALTGRVQPGDEVLSLIHILTLPTNREV